MGSVFSEPSTTSEEESTKAPRRDPVSVVSIDVGVGERYPIRYDANGITTLDVFDRFVARLKSDMDVTVTGITIRSFILIDDLVPADNMIEQVKKIIGQYRFRPRILDRLTLLFLVHDFSALGEMLAPGMQKKYADKVAANIISMLTLFNFKIGSLNIEDILQRPAVKVSDARRTNQYTTMNLIGKVIMNDDVFVSAATVQRDDHTHNGEANDNHTHNGVANDNHTHNGVAK